MGCCASAEAPDVEHVEQAEEFERPKVDAEDLRSELASAESKAVEAGPEKHTFLGSVLRARASQATNAEVMEECCTRLKQHTRSPGRTTQSLTIRCVAEPPPGQSMGAVGL